jgi:hypothetical protein
MFQGWSGGRKDLASGLRRSCEGDLLKVRVGRHLGAKVFPPLICSRGTPYPNSHDKLYDLRDRAGLCCKKLGRRRECQGVGEPIGAGDDLFKPGLLPNVAKFADYSRMTGYTEVTRLGHNFPSADHPPGTRTKGSPMSALP